MRLRLEHITTLDMNQYQHIFMEQMAHLRLDQDQLYLYEYYIIGSRDQSGYGRVLVGIPSDRLLMHLQFQKENWGQARLTSRACTKAVSCR